MPRRPGLLVAVVVAVPLVAASAPAVVAGHGGPLLAPGDAPALDASMARHGRQFYGITAVPFGLSLDTHPRADAVDTIESFCAQGATDDFQEATGQHPFEVVERYGEYGDLGFFGGVALAGTAYEYMTHRRDGAPPEVLERSRARLVRAAKTWHLFKVIPGVPGVVARGLRRMVSEDPDSPPIPVDLPELVPLFDDEGAPLPQPKNNGAYRADNSEGALPEGEWIWKDSCSKDQLVGQVFAMAALYDAMKDDPDIDQGLVETLSEDARLIGEMLMVPRDIATLEVAQGRGIYDLIIMDADGRPTFHHDLNPFSIEKFYVSPTSGTWNLFNTVMAVGVLTGLHHVSGDPALERFLYEEILGTRDLLGMIARWREPGVIDYTYAGVRTNFDNPDMTAVALWLGIHLQSDPAVTAILRTYLEQGWWLRDGESHSARYAKQPLWHAIYLTLTDRGSDPALIGELAALLEGFDLGPYWNPQRINCDEAEIEARECLAIDGMTVLEIQGFSDRGQPMAREALDPRIRPPSNFDARSNPFVVNGGGGLRLNPGGDLLASYWIARHMAHTAAGEVQGSPFARAHMPVGGWPDGAPPAPDGDATDTGGDADAGAGSADVDAGAGGQGGGDGGCAAQGAASPAWWTLAWLLIVARRRRRADGSDGSASAGPGERR